MPNYKLTLSEKQAHCIKSACEAQFRLEAGQFCAVSDAMHEYLHHDDWQLLVDKVKELEQFIWQLPRKKTTRSEYSEMSWDLYQVIRHKLSWDKAIKDEIIKEGERRKWPEMSTVNYDDPVHRSAEPLCLIEKV